MKIGLYGGTFNPPHAGHVRMANAFYEAVQPDKMLVVPNKRPVHKIAEDLALDEERLDLCRLAFRDEKFEVSDMEIQREKPSFTLYTLQELRRQYPDAEICLLMGSDMFLSFHKWYHYAEILQETTLYVASRENEVDKAALRTYAFDVLRIFLCGKPNEKVKILPIAPLEVSSSSIRATLKKGLLPQKYMDEQVLQYIKEHEMYGYREKR